MEDNGSMMLGHGHSHCFANWKTTFLSSLVVKACDVGKSKHGVREWRKETKGFSQNMCICSTVHHAAVLDGDGKHAQIIEMSAAFQNSEL